MTILEEDYKIEGTLKDIKITRFSNGQVNELLIEEGSSLVSIPYFGHIDKKEVERMKGHNVIFSQKFNPAKESSDSYINQALIGKGYQGALGILEYSAWKLYFVKVKDIYNPKVLGEIFDH